MPRNALSGNLQWRITDNTVVLADAWLWAIESVAERGPRALGLNTTEYAQLAPTATVPQGCAGSG